MRRNIGTRVGIKVSDNRKIMKIINMAEERKYEERQAGKRKGGNERVAVQVSR